MTVADEPEHAPAEADHDWGDLSGGLAPEVDSPPLASEMPVGDEETDAAPPESEPAMAPDPVHRPAVFARPPRPSLLRRLVGPARRRAARPIITLPIACAAMAALVIALTIWRTDVVRLLPQTAAFYKLIGLEVNLRGLTIKDVKISSETVDGKPVLVIEGAIFDVARKPVELPRLRFVVRDERGSEIYAWNALLEQPMLKPGEKAWFRSRLASPPSEAHSIDVRFFTRRDLSAGGI